MERTVFNAALAGLLHDIGKFALRAGEKPAGGWKAAEKEAGYVHAAVSWQVLDKDLPCRWRDELRPILYHHKLNDATEQNLVSPTEAHRLALADWLSSGEREEAEEEDPQGVPYVLSPLSRLAGHTARRFYPALSLRELDRENAIPAERGPRSGKEDFERLWEGFLREAGERLNLISDEQRYLEALYALLQEYTWCVPSAYATYVSDVSLFDHARTTAALNVALTMDGRDLAWCKAALAALRNKDKPAPELEEAAALLIAGDISGVQHFIYTITSSGAAKSLRGRSFYLSILTEAVARFVLRRLGLPITNLIYAGGGNFIILAPVRAKGQLRSIQAEISRILIDAHDGHLHLALAGSPVRLGDFRIGRFAQAWKVMHTDLAKEKLHPFAYLGKEALGELVGSPMGEGGDDDSVCKVCEHEFGPGEDKHAEESAGESITKCAMCYSFEKLGNYLARARWLVRVHYPPADQPDAQSLYAKGWKGVLRAFGLDIWAVGDLNEVRVGEAAEMVAFHSMAGDGAEKLPKAWDSKAVPVFRPFAQLVPLTVENGEERPKTFDELCEESRGGFKRWGVLRMDVDNLGFLFEKGFTQYKKDEADEKEVNRLSLSRVAGLSFAMGLFFEHLLPMYGTSEVNQDFAGRLYIQYAGGDDLFVVGSWDALPLFALEVRKAFRRFACENPSVTLSGGITLAPEKYPLYQAAKDAEDAENAAKRYRRPAKEMGEEAHEKKREKDALHFLGVSLGWEHFIEAWELMDKLTAWVHADHIPKAVLQFYVMLYVTYREESRRAAASGRCAEDQLYLGPWVWRHAYHLARRLEGERIPEEVKTALWECERRLLQAPVEMEIMGLSARWAQYLTR